MQCPTDCHESLHYVIFMLCVHKIMDPNPTDVKLDMLRSNMSSLRLSVKLTKSY